MIRTRVGYAGGRAKSPDYGNIGDHTETVQVDYDPARITYSQLLDIFWESHQPTRPSGSGQYMRAVFYHDEKQQQAAQASKKVLEQKTSSTINTEVVPLRSFTMAEDYHQKYLLKQHPLRKEMSRIYPGHRDFVNSTAVARLNGYAGRNGTEGQLSREIESYGLSVEGKKALVEMVTQR